MKVSKQSDDLRESILGNLLRKLRKLVIIQSLLHKQHKPSKIAKKIRGKPKRQASSGIEQVEAPFHMGILPSQYNSAQSELEKVGRGKRRKEW